MRWLWIVLGMAVFSMSATADQVVLKNGDRLSGTIVKADDKSLVMKTEFAGEVTLQWPAVVQIESTQPLHLAVKDGSTVVGPVSTSDGNLVVATGSGAATVPKSDVATVRSDAEQTAYEKTLRPGLREGWAGGANFGLALARGNSETVSLSTGVDLARATLKDKLSVYTTSVYAKDSLKNILTANSIQGGLRYDRNVTKRLFGYGSGDFETNDLQKLDLRSILGGGLGWHAVNKPRSTLDVLGGLAWTHESYGTGLTHNLMSPSIGEDFTYKLAANTVFKEKVFFFPYISGGAAGQYRVAFDSGLSTRISRWLAWQTTITDRYVSNPLPGTKGNDLLLSTGLGLTFAGAKK